MAGNTLFRIGKNDDSTGGITITARVTGSTRQGFLTLWALFFLAGISLLVILVVSGQAARRESTTRLITEYNHATIEAANDQACEKSTGSYRCKAVKRGLATKIA